LIEIQGANIVDSIACINKCESEKTDATAEQAPEINVEKVLSIRSQLGKGRYCIAEKLDVVVDILLEKLLNQ
jgi:hypothetical protein